jgi:ABC-type multidrug transport system fused ATPase/permease subunit
MSRTSAFHPWKALASTLITVILMMSAMFVLSWRIALAALVSFERVFEVLDLPPMLREKPGAVPIPAGPAEVSFEHVSFHYQASGHNEAESAFRKRTSG